MKSIYVDDPAESTHVDGKGGELVETAGTSATWRPARD
jgi:hypothetical protein